MYIYTCNYKSRNTFNIFRFVSSPLTLTLTQTQSSSTGIRSLFIHQQLTLCTIINNCYSSSIFYISLILISQLDKAMEVKTPASVGEQWLSNIQDYDNHSSVHAALSLSFLLQADLPLSLIP